MSHTRSRYFAPSNGDWFSTRRCGFLAHGAEGTVLRGENAEGLLVKAGACDGVDHQAGLIAELRARSAGDEFHGLDGIERDTSVFRIDHDQAFQRTTHVIYRRPHNGPWAAFTWRYDSGLVAGAVGSLDDALGLTRAQQAAIGFYCGSQFATRPTPSGRARRRTTGQRA